MEAAYWKCFITKIWLFRNSQLYTLSLVQTYLYVLIKKTKESPLLWFFLSLFLPDLCAAVTSESPQCSNNKAHVYLYLSDLTYITWPTAICRFAFLTFEKFCHYYIYFFRTFMVSFYCCILLLFSMWAIQTQSCLLFPFLLKVTINCLLDIPLIPLGVLWVRTSSIKVCQV